MAAVGVTLSSKAMENQFALPAYAVPPTGGAGLEKSIALCLSAAKAGASIQTVRLYMARQMLHETQSLHSKMMTTTTAQNTIGMTRMMNTGGTVVQGTMDITMKIITIDTMRMNHVGMGAKISMGEMKPYTVTIVMRWATYIMLMSRTETEHITVVKIRSTNITVPVTSMGMLTARTIRIMTLTDASTRSLRTLAISATVPNAG
mmetsp:Transcript_38396/g.87991  ORF Transcript_38396/g.87991 Transcript_38396/m.87991 type:complete len:204 (+) Transcript_38396:206-817(+)